MQTILIIIDCVIGVLLIASILLQQGKGAEMGSSFGAGAAGALFGPVGAGSFLSRSTSVLAAIFFVNTLALALLSKQTLSPVQIDLDELELEQEELVVPVEEYGLDEEDISAGEVGDDQPN